MLYRTLARGPQDKTEEKVSILGFGCMRLPLLADAAGDPTKIDEAEAIKQIRYAIDKGVNYLDTAYPYHSTNRAVGGASEPLVAKALRDGYREKVKIATKLPSWMVTKHEDMEKLLDEQLKRLETKHIDFYLIHNINHTVWDALKNAEFGKFLDKALADGKIKHAGFSFHDKLDMFKEIVDAYDWSFCQIQYNYLDEQFQAGTEGLRYAANKGLGVVIMEPLRGGRLANELPDAARQVFKAAKADRTPAAWALRWVWDKPEVSVVLSGMNAIWQIDDNLKTASEAVAGAMSKDEIAAVDRVKAIFKEKMKVSCTTCGYCMPCPTGVDIPTCFSCYNNHFMFGSDDLYKMRLAPGQRASVCVECGICETQCPQGIQIREELKKVRALFE